MPKDVGPDCADAPRLNAEIMKQNKTLANNSILLRDYVPQYFDRVFFHKLNRNY